MSVTEETVRLAQARKQEVLRYSDDTLYQLTQAWVDTWDELEPEFLQLTTEVLSSHPDGISAAQLDRLERVTQSMDRVQARLEELTDHANWVSNDQVERIVRSTPGNHLQQLASQLPPGIETSRFGLAGPPEVALAAIVARTTTRIESQFGPQFTTEAVQSVKRNLVRGIARGQNPNVTAQDIVDQVQGAFAGGLTRATRIARTEQLDAMRAASAATQQANSDVADGWIWMATLDQVLCGACLVMHGQRFDNEVVGPEGHPNCRCTSVAATKSWEELGLVGVPEPPSALPDAQEWFNSLTEDTKHGILGPGKLELLNNGEIQWGDLAQRRENPDWRAAYYETPLRDLKNQEG